ncbi:Putative 3-oxoacyl-[acyl-carrier-protein] reductase [Aspergillus calidoustus]|uniref:Putative 3-oxoacyl-[acyl-carrier-protein] reductase n=1 Tax=Aspergillus calidoustus TaxID=454130 RepID=A0A0U5GW61_ASPCI|nr:Putative 3-oxoacyl-[acyl-carrier-protein] reductase [Aspergillus calidoustus]
MATLPGWNILKGKTAAITGGTTGIGRAIALEFIRQGCNVAINHLGVPKDEHLRHSLLAEAAVKQWGRLHIFVANAGVFKQAEFLEIEPALLKQSLDVNVQGAFYSCQAAARQMVVQGEGGSIIAISSVSALVGGGLQTHYMPTKAAVLSLMQSMAISLGKHNIRCNALLPGTINTQLADHDMKNPTKKAYLEGRIPLGRIGDPEDIAGPAVFLASEHMSRYVNGSGLLADGGMFSNLQ